MDGLNFPINTVTMTFNMSKEFVLYVLDLLEPLGNVTACKMFGGQGIYLNNQMVAIVADDVLYLKTDSQTEAQFQQGGLSPFSYQRHGKSVSMSYYHAPDEVLENPEEMREWATLAYQAALRSSNQKNRK
jgi:DNA transformation protein